MFRVKLCALGPALVIMLLLLILAALLPAAGGWPGTDELAEDLNVRLGGREARGPYINTDQGNLLLFVFTLGALAGGIAIGYYWRELFDLRQSRGG